MPMAIFVISTCNRARLAQQTRERSHSSAESAATNGTLNPEGRKKTPPRGAHPSNSAASLAPSKEQIPRSRDGGHGPRRSGGGSDSCFLRSVCPRATGAIVYIRPLLPKPADGRHPLRRPRLEYTRFERARIIGARALQLSMGAPPLIETPADVRNPVRVAMLEYEDDAIPLTVKRTKTHQVRT